MQHKTLDVITLFHKASSPASLRVHALLKQEAAKTAAYATLDQASDISAQSQPRREEFELDVTEEPPTEDQLHSILEYVGPHRAGDVVAGAKDESDALKKLQMNKNSFQRPLVFQLLLHICEQMTNSTKTVDWNNGRAVVGDNESEILKMINSLPK
jgi:arsenate reductase-like glutaredoxin family protein